MDDCDKSLEELQKKTDLFKSEREVVESQKKWIENSKHLTNISTLEAQRHWISETITEREFAEKLLTASDESIKINNFTLIGAKPEEVAVSSPKELGQMNFLNIPVNRSNKYHCDAYQKICNYPVSLKTTDPLHKSTSCHNVEVRSLKKIKTLREKQQDDKKKMVQHLSERKYPPTEAGYSKAICTPRYSVSKGSPLKELRVTNNNNSLEKSVGTAAGSRRSSTSDVSEVSKISRNATNCILKQEKKYSDMVRETCKNREESDLSKLHHSYDKEEMRKFIKQKQKERYERILQENRLKENKIKEKLQKLEHLKQTQKKIIENSKMKPSVKSPEKPEWIGPMERISMRSRISDMSRYTSVVPCTKAKSLTTGAIVFKNSASMNDTVLQKKPSSAISDLEVKASQMNVKQKLTPMNANLSQRSRPSSVSTISDSMFSGERETCTNAVNKSKTDDLSQTTPLLDVSVNFQKMPETNFGQNMTEASPIFNIPDDSRNDLKLESNILSLPKLHLDDSTAQPFYFSPSCSASFDSFKDEQKPSPSYVGSDQLEFGTYTRVTRKRRSSKDDEMSEENQSIIKMKKLQPSLECLNKNSKVPFHQKKCLDCLESLDWGALNSAPLLSDGPSVSQLLKIFRNEKEQNDRLITQNLVFEKLNTEDTAEQQFTLEMPSSSSARTEAINSFEYINAKNPRRSDIDLIEDNNFRLTLESMVLRAPSISPLSNVTEEGGNSLRPVTSQNSNNLCDKVLPDFSNVNTRRSMTSSSDHETTVSQSLSVDPLTLSSSIENLNLVPNGGTKSLSGAVDSKKNENSNLLQPDSEDEFLSKCASLNSNVSHLIDNLPRISKEDDHTSFLRQDTQLQKSSNVQCDKFEKKFVEKCASHNSNLSSIDILKSSEAEAQSSADISQEYVKISEPCSQDKQLPVYYDLQNSRKPCSTRSSLQSINESSSHRKPKITSDKNISLRMKAKEHLPHSTKSPKSASKKPKKTYSSLSFVQVPEHYLQDINKSVCLGSSSSNVNLSDRPSCEHLSALSNSSLVKEDVIKSESSDRRNLLKKGEKPKPLVDSNLSDHSSSYSEIVKVSRTVSRGSTVVSEISEVHTLSSGSVKFNSSSLHNRIKNEIQQLDRLEENISSVLDTTRISTQIGKQLLRKEDKLNLSFDVQSVNSSNSCSIEQHTNDVNSTDLAEQKRELGAGVVDISNISGINITTFSFEMLNDLLKDEDLKYEHHAAVIKLREKALIDRAKAEIAYLEMQKRDLKEQGRDEEVRNIKKKQRGVVVRVDEELQEIQRIRKAEKNASRERKLLIQQQQQLLKLQMGSKYYSLKRSPSSKTYRGGSSRILNNVLDSTLNANCDRGDRSSSLTPYLERKTRELQEKENILMARKKNIESIVAWKQRLDQEEKKVQEMEKLIALSPSVVPHHNHAIDRGTSPLRFIIDHKEHATSTDIPDSVVQAQLPAHISTASQSESETQNKEYNSDSFEQSSVVSEQLLTNVTTRNTQSSILDNKRKKSIAALRVPLSPRVTILKRRHSSGSDESILFSQNETLSEQSDMEVRVSALQQQLKMRKAELEKLRKEYNKSQRERLRAKEQSLISQIQAYDSYIEQVKNELQKENDKNEIKVMKPQIKQPKFCERKKNEVFVTQEKKKEDITSDSSSIDHSLSPNHKTSSFIEPVSEVLERDSSETLDSVKTQLESRVFDSPEVSLTKEIEHTSQVKSSDVVETDVISKEEYSTENQTVTSEEVIENIMEEESEIKSGDLSIAEEGVIVGNLSEAASITKNTKFQLHSLPSAEEPCINNSSSNIVHSSSGKVVSSDGSLLNTDNESKSQQRSISEELNQEVAVSENDIIEDEDAVLYTHSKTESKITESIEKNTIHSQSNVPEHISEMVESHISAILDVASQTLKDEDKSISQEYSSGKEVAGTNELTEKSQIRSGLSTEAPSANEQSSHNVSEMVSEIKEQLETISKFLIDDQHISAYSSFDSSALEGVNKSAKTADNFSGHSQEDSVKNDLESFENVSDSKSHYSSSQVITDNEASSLHSNHDNSQTSKASSVIEALSMKEDDFLDLTPLAQLNVPADSFNKDNMDNLEINSSKNKLTELLGSEDNVLKDTLEDIKMVPPEICIEEIEEVTDKSEYRLFEKSTSDKFVGITDLFTNNYVSKRGEGVDSTGTSEVVSEQDLVQEIDISSTSSQGVNDEFKIYIDNESSPVSNDRKAKIIDLLQDSFEISDKLWEENLENYKNEETPLLTALQMERQNNLNIDYIWRDICDSCVSEATDAFITAFTKKKSALAYNDGVNKEDQVLDTDRVGDNEGFWLGEGLTLQTAREAEQLRLQQLQIEQEIEELEQAQEAVPYYYVREIPNKPPPPYTPPGRVAPTPEETVARVGEAAAMLWEVEQSGGDVATQILPPNFLPSPNDQPHRLFLFELAKELYFKARSPPAPSLPTWMVTQRSGKPTPKISTKEDFLKYVERQTKLVFGYEPRIMRENMIMKWSRKKRDQVDEILIRECQEEEQEWIDFSKEENLVKNQLADAIIDKVLEDAVNGLSLAFAKKFKDDDIS